MLFAGRRGLLGVGAGLVLLTVGGQASAYDGVTVECDAADEDTPPGQCQVAGIGFQATNPNAVDLSFDTGWVPSGSPLQVRLAAGVWSKTDVALAGYLAADWPDAILLSTPGKVDGGLLDVHYGALIAAEAKIGVTVLGQTLSFTGPIPYIPQFDFTVEESQIFDSWAFAPGVTVQGETEPATLAEVGIEEFINSNLPGFDGGFALVTSMELTTTYVTHRLHLTNAETGETVSGGDIESQDALSMWAHLGGSAFEVDVVPDGQVNYDGVLHMTPSLFVEFLGQSFNMPIFDIPIPFQVETPWEFKPMRIHVPLPDILADTAPIEFTSVEVGEMAFAAPTVDNLGEANLYFVAESSNDAIVVSPEVVVIAPGESQELPIAFNPSVAGKQNFEVRLLTNDPDSPVVTLAIDTDASGGRFTVDGDLLTDGGAQSNDAADGCGCQTPGHSGTSHGGAPHAAGMLIAIAAWTARQRKRGTA